MIEVSRICPVPDACFNMKNLQELNQRTAKELVDYWNDLYDIEMINDSTIERCRGEDEEVCPFSDWYRSLMNELFFDQAHVVVYGDE